MKANELKINNLIDVINRSNEVHLPTGIVLKIIAVGLFEAQCIPNEILITEADSSVIMDIPLRDLSPIPITSEWLERLGFEETYNSQFRIKFDHPCNYIGFDFSKNEDKSMEGFRYYGHYIKIKYIHTLQNIYFALTGKELEIT